MDSRILSKDEFLLCLNKKKYQVVDTRIAQSYNGFYEDGVKGHIKNSINFPVEWLDYIIDKKASQFVQDKGIEKNNIVIITDISYTRAIRVYDYLYWKCEIKEIRLFIELEQLYISNPEVFNSYPGFEMLVSSEWVLDLINGNTPEGAKDKYLIFYCNSNTNQNDYHYRKYLDIHIQGAGYINVDELESNPLWDINDFESVKTFFEKKGISNEFTVVLYSESSAAYRVWLILTWFGIEDVRVMDGGPREWYRKALPVDNGEETTFQHTSIDIFCPKNSDIVIQTGKEILELQKSKNLKLVSVRSWEEFSCVIDGYDDHPDIKKNMRRVGEPQGAIWGYASKNMKGYYNPDGTLRNPDEIKRLFEMQGLTENDLIAFYCGTGWRATVPLFITKMLGWKNTHLYGGSWIEWEKDLSLPVKEASLVLENEPSGLNDYGQY